RHHFHHRTGSNGRRATLLGVRAVVALACVWAIAWTAAPAGAARGEEPFTGSVSTIDRDTRRLNGRLVLARGVPDAAPGPPDRAGDLPRVRRGAAPRATRGAPTVGGRNP